MNRAQRRAADRAQRGVKVIRNEDAPQIGDPAERIAAVTGESADDALWACVALIEKGYEPAEVVILVDRAIEAGITVSELERRLGPRADDE